MSTQEGCISPKTEGFYENAFFDQKHGLSLTHF